MHSLGVFFLALFLCTGLLCGYSYYKMTSYRISGTITPPHNQRIIVFDFDGTIADTFELLVTTYNTIAPRYKVNLIDEHSKQTLRD